MKIELQYTKLKMTKQELRYTHPSNFYHSSLKLMNDAWVVHKKNLKDDTTKSGKKSHSESGDAALAILILIIKLEADLRSRFDYVTKRSDENSDINPLQIMQELAKEHNGSIEVKTIEKYKKYLNELLLVRNIIAHGYLYEGEIYFDDNWEVSELKGSNVTGRQRNKIGEDGRTQLLKLETSPYKLCVFDSIIVYRTIETIREMTGLDLQTESILHAGKYIEMKDWLTIAVEGMDEETDAIIKSLVSDYYEIMSAGWDD